MGPLILFPVAFLGSAVSGTLGLGGGVLLIAAMAAILPPAVVVPVHGAVQLAANSTRMLALRSNVRGRIVALYAPPMALGAWLGLELYRGEELAWFRPAVGGLVLASLLLERTGMSRRIPTWALVPAGLVGGFLTITVGATGPYLAAILVGGDLERRELVATQAAIQTFGHLLKIPAFAAIGFAWRDQLPTILPLVACVAAGTLAGTRLLARLPERGFRRALRALLVVLAIRLLASPWA